MIKKILSWFINWNEVLRKRKICSKCEQYTSNNIKALGKYGKFHSCGKFLCPVKGVSCGCDIELKTLLTKKAFDCPQNKW